MQSLVRTDLISIFDLGFDDSEKLSPLLSRFEEGGSSSRVLQRLETSFDWLFYDEQLEDFTLIDISPQLPNTAGAVLRLNLKSRIGTFVVWRIDREGTDPLELKRMAWEKCDEDLDILTTLCGELRTERYYPFVALRVDTHDLDEFTKNHAEEIGRIFTGDLEGERPSTLRGYVAEDMSLRSYEKVLMRWTGALAIYSQTKEEHYENCVFRAVQVFEHCILARVSLLSLDREADTFLRHLAIITPAKWLKSREILAAFSSAEETFVMYPRVQSVEADRLITTAHLKFGIDKVVAGAKAKKAELQDQLQWARAQTLGLLAFVTYLLDKIIGWDNVRLVVARMFQHVFRS